MAASQWASWVWPVARLRTSADVGIGTANAAVSVTYAAVAGKQHCVGLVNWSHSGGTPAGTLRILDEDGNVLFEQDITAAGAGFSPVFLAGPLGKALTVRLLAAGSGITGKLSVDHWMQ